MKTNKLKTMQSIAIIALVAIIGFAVIGCNDGDIAVTGVSLSQSTLYIIVGKTEALTATVAPDNATNKAVTWSTSDAAKATVANGVVTAVSEGPATITVTTVDGNKTATCDVMVLAALPPGSTLVSGVSLNEATLALTVDQLETLTATVTPNDATNKTLNWSSSNSGVATVDGDGWITAVSAGTTTITVSPVYRTNTNVKATCAVTVTSGNNGNDNITGKWLTPVTITNPSFTGWGGLGGETGNSFNMVKEATNTYDCRITYLFPMEVSFFPKFTVSFTITKTADTGNRAKLIFSDHPIDGWDDDDRTFLEYRDDAFPYTHSIGNNQLTIAINKYDDSEPTADFTIVINSIRFHY